MTTNRLAPEDVEDDLTRQLLLDFTHRASHLEDDFIEGDGNELALAYIRAFPNWSHPLTLLTGPAKSGKSHLLQIWSERAGAKKVTTTELETCVDRAGPIAIDDVDSGAFDENTLFHLMNRSIRDARPTLMTSTTDIAQWPFLTDDLKSRARLATRLTIAVTDDIQLSQMFVKLFSDRQVTVDPKVISYVVKRMERSPQEAVLLVDAMDRMALARGTAVTKRIAASALLSRGVAASLLDAEGEHDA